MNYKIYRMYFEKGVRIGQGKLDGSDIEINADVIFSSLINEASYMKLYDCKKLINYFEKGEILLSDGFPFIDEEYFLPKPFLNFIEKDGDSNKKKQFKKLKYIPLSNWKEFTLGKSDPLLLNEEIEKLGKYSLDSKIKYSNLGDHEIYNVSYYKFSKGNGIYFILGYRDKEKIELIEKIMDSLKFTGIGGKKSNGLGRFEFISNELPELLKNKINTSSSKMLMTSSMAKENELKEVLNEECQYALIRRGGYIYSEDEFGRKYQAKRKKTMYFFKSGSIFKKKFEGDIFRVDNSFIHPVYRYSKPIWMEVD